MNALASQVYNRLVDAMVEAQAQTDEMRRVCDEFEAAHRRFCRLLEFPPVAQKKKAGVGSTGPRAA